MATKRPADAKHSTDLLRRYCPTHHVELVEGATVLWCDAGDHEVKKPNVVNSRTMKVVHQQ